MTGWALVAAGLLLLANGAFVAVEFALLAARRPNIERLAAEGSRRARAAASAMGDLSDQLAGAQLGITMASLGLGFVAEPAVGHLIEEIVGEIHDEHDPRPELTVVVRPGTYDLSGSLHPHEVLEICGFELPEGDYETLAGFVLERMGAIPEPGDRIGHEGWTLEVLELDRRRIATVRLVAPPATEPGP